MICFCISGSNMKRISVRLISFLFTLTFFSCAKTLHEATWKTLPELNVPYDQAWNVIVNTMAKDFELEVIDKQSGYIKSGWKTIDTCWAGLFYGGWVPCTRVKAIVRVEERTPLKIKVKVEKERANPWTNYQTWTKEGNDENLEKEIIYTNDKIGESLVFKPIRFPLHR